MHCVRRAAYQSFASCAQPPSRLSARETRDEDKNEEVETLRMVYVVDVDRNVATGKQKEAKELLEMRFLCLFNTFRRI